MITINGYHVTEQIYASSKTLVYRGYRADSQLAVVFKLLRTEYPSPEELARFRHEYEFIRSLDQTGAISAYDLQRYGHTLVMILEDFGGESLERLLPERVGPEEFLKLAIPITTVIGALHARNVVHKALSPANILWNRATGEIRIIDFALATTLARETPALGHSQDLEASLAYLSPEQTGRMNRSVDYRTDFYTLGVTFYELLTGQLPFATDDPIEVVHAHIARAPLPPKYINPSVPAAISAIVMKLLAKTAEERYQSADGLGADLEQCARQLQHTGRIERFSPGQHDSSDRFQIPEKLYGRDAELAQLHATLDRVAQGQANTVFCLGEAGAGKSLLIREIYRPTVEKQGYFIVGKYDQFKSNLPYTGIAQAFGHFIQQILTESEASLGRWKTALLQAVGNNGQIIADIIPELELIIGPQPAAQPLPALEAQNRFHYLFQNLVLAVTQRQLPLVLVLDDLQWADPASLSLLKLLAAAPDLRHLLILAAYRDTEVAAGHPLLLVMESLRRSGAVMSTLQLGSLSLADVSQLIGDALHCTAADARAMATLVYEKTHGNAFFVTQFLLSLREGDSPGNGQAPEAGARRSAGRTHRRLYRESVRSANPCPGVPALAERHMEPAASGA
jgi:serine/threonine protein kinase